MPPESILSIFLTPALAAALGPAADAMINNHAAAAQLALAAVGKGDAVGLAQVIFEWYATSFIDKPCALLPKDVQDTVCGKLSEAIKFISETGADLVKGVLGIGKGILEALGVWGAIDDAATFVWDTLKDFVGAIGKFLGIGGDDKDKWKPDPSCGSLTPEGYFAANYMACVTKATNTAAAFGTVDTSKLDAACTDAFNKCIPPKDRAVVGQTCGAMANALADLGRNVAGAIKTAASSYTGMGGPASYVNTAWEFAHNEMFGPGAADFCDPNFWATHTLGYASKCSSFVNRHFPEQKSASQGGPTCTAMVTTTSAAVKSCIDSLKSNTTKNALVGPNSDYCKKQEKWIADHPCSVKNTGKVIRLPDGRTINDITIHCTTRLVRLDPWLGTGIDILRLPPSTGSRISPVVLAPGSEVFRRPQGSSGINMIDGRTGNAPTSRSDRLKASAPVVTPGSVVLRPRPSQSGGSSGTNTSRSSAVDRLTGDGMGGGLRSGGSSGATPVQGQSRRPAVGASGSSSGINTSRSGGSSGTNMINSGSGNSPMGSSGSNTSRPGGSSGTNLSRQP